MDMENFYIALNAVVPLFCLMLVGVFIKRMRLLSPEELVHVNRMVFTIFFSIMMFYNIYTTDLSSTFKPGLMLFGLLSVIGIFLAALVVVCFFDKDNRRRGALIQSQFRSNFVLMGIPLVGNMFGPEEVAVTTMMVAVIVPAYNVFGVITLETFRGKKFALLPIFIGVLKNPMILGALTGAFLLLLGVPVPKAVLKPLGQITAATSPLALIILGASFSFGSVSRCKLQLVLGVLGKLVIFPGIVMFLAMELGFRGGDFLTLISIFCTPCAVASFAMAQQMDSDAELAGNLVVFTSAISCVTIFCWILFFKGIGMF